MIRHLEISGLNGLERILKFDFHSDLNLLTGLNGCGKTTILKIIWFVNCGLIRELLTEVVFSKIELVADNYSVAIEKKDSSVYQLQWNTKEGDRKQDIVVDDDNYISRRDLLDFLDAFYEYGEDSVFFPTFRRIEGGFSMANTMRRYKTRSTFPLKEALIDLSDELSSRKHQFIASVSTDDITSLLNKEYSSIVRDINELQRKQFEEIRKRIVNKENQLPDVILSEIESDINTVEQERNSKLKPFTILSDLIMRIFQKKGIAMEGIVLGDVHNAIASDKLSAGEKQMLSFLCYNTFSKEKIIFIDEPELSLHPDWQRMLISTLLRQGNNNQFFIATHSPFIYTKYSDKEIIVDSDKGGN